MLQCFPVTSLVRPRAVPAPHTPWVPSALPLHRCTFCPTGSALYFCFREDYRPGNLQLTAAENPPATQGKHGQEQEWGGCPGFRVGSTEEENRLLRTEGIYQLRLSRRLF